MPSLRRAVGQRPIFPVALFCTKALAWSLLFYICSAPPRPSKQRQTAFHPQALATSPDRLLMQAVTPTNTPPNLSGSFNQDVSLTVHVQRVASAKSGADGGLCVKEGALHSQCVDGDGWVRPDGCRSSGIQTMAGQREMPLVIGRAWCLAPGSHWLMSNWLYHCSFTTSP